MGIFTGLWCEEGRWAPLSGPMPFKFENAVATLFFEVCWWRDGLVPIPVLVKIDQKWHQSLEYTGFWRHGSLYQRMILKF